MSPLPHRIIGGSKERTDAKNTLGDGKNCLKWFEVSSNGFLKSEGFFESERPVMDPHWVDVRLYDTDGGPPS